MQTTLANSKKGFIYETLNEVATLTSHKSSDGLMHLSGCFGKCGVLNNNKRIYETSNYKKMVENMQARLKKAPIGGELEHPQTMNIDLKNISHRIDSIDIDENGVITGEITLLNTPKGLVAQAIVEGGLPLFISSRAQGQVDNNGYVTLECIQTYDLVGSPGFSEAELHLNENMCFESLGSNICFIETPSDDTTPDIKENTLEFKKESNKNSNNMNDIAKLEQKLERFSDVLEEMQDTIDEQSRIIETLKYNNKQQLSKDVVENLADAIQTWITEEYTPTIADKIQGWITEEYTPTITDWVTEEYTSTIADKIQDWVTEEYTPTITDKIQDWVTEEYTPTIADKIQDWVVEEYSPELQNYMEDELIPEVNESIRSNNSDTIQEKLSSIESVLNILEKESTPKKPVYNGHHQALINEDLSNEPKYIKMMPSDKRVLWEMADKSVKESIYRKAKLYNFSQPGTIQKFWESVNFESIKPINESQNEDLSKIQNLWERDLRKQIRSWNSKL